MNTFAVVTPDGQRREISGERHIVAAAALFLGDGRYQLEAPDGSRAMPDLSTSDLNGILRERRHDVAAALRSVDLPQAKFLANMLGMSDPRRSVNA